MKTMLDLLDDARNDPFQVDSFVTLRAEQPAHERGWKHPDGSTQHITTTGHLLGATYFDMYWGIQYVVVGENQDGTIRCLSNDGHDRTHRTHRTHLAILVRVNDRPIWRALQMA